MVCFFCVSVVNKNELDLNKKYYNLNELKKEIYKKIRQNNKKFFLKNDVLFCSFENKSGWLKEFNNDNNKIIYFPEKTKVMLMDNHIVDYGYDEYYLRVQT